MRKINIDDMKTAKVLLWLFVFADGVIPCILGCVFIYLAVKDCIIQ